MDLREKLDGLEEIALESGLFKRYRYYICDGCYII